jgi:hypothetical protein
MLLEYYLNFCDVKSKNKKVLKSTAIHQLQAHVLNRS